MFNEISEAASVTFYRLVVNCLGTKDPQRNEGFVIKNNNSGEMRIFGKKVHTVKKFEELYAHLVLMEMASIVSSTGCHIPCQYNEYKFLNIDIDIVAGLVWGRTGALYQILHHDHLGRGGGHSRTALSALEKLMTLNRGEQS